MVNNSCAFSNLRRPQSNLNSKVVTRVYEKKNMRFIYAFVRFLINLYLWRKIPSYSRKLTVTSLSRK